MLRSYWIAAVALGLTGFASLAQEVSPPSVKGDPVTESWQQEGAPEGENIPEGERGPTIDVTPALDSIEAAIRDLIPDEDQVERQRQIENDTRDLDAQEAMAKWAFWMFVATNATVLLTLAALIAIIRTLHHTRRAADYARDMVVEAKATTAAANASVAETSRIGEAQIRAYVGIDDFSFDMKGEHPVFVISIKNFGQSPARKVRHVIEWSNEKPAGYAKFRDDEFSLFDLGSGKDSHIALRARDLQGKVLDDFLTGGLSLWVFASIEYNDVFVKPHVTRIQIRTWCEVRSNGEHTVNMALSQDGNESD